MPDKSPIEKFIEAINKSDKLRLQCQEALDGSDNPDKFVALAAKNGYQFTVEEAKSYFERILHAPSSKAVSPKQMQHVVALRSNLPVTDPMLNASRKQ